MILAKRACFRFYGDETIAYYTVHAHRDMESLDDDNMLNLLTSDTKAMHDHNAVNYNEKYSFGNIECTKTCVVRAISKDIFTKAGLVSCSEYYMERHALKLC